MTNIDKLMAAGADSVAGLVMRGSVVLANHFMGEWVLTDAGKAELEIDDVPVKSEVTKAEMAAMPVVKVDGRRKKIVE